MAPRLKLSGVVLPDGERRDLWVVDGLIRTEPVGDAEAVPGGWLLPGLVARADRIVFPVDCISHHAVAGIKRLSRQAGKPYVPLRTASLACLLAAMVEMTTQPTPMAAE